ncbi:hypothetical protein BJ322DRAFT_1052833 [Thelephora terrestris]|uniref:Elongator complex protein 5 n=1 Tax=Thelephora terrestris TaxID=56493 RepID=A0A9P6HGS6_9AGAM|nr:hypothetical protein BJ322DRAFT_1052833 [Thelephora terrestris]
MSNGLTIVQSSASQSALPVFRELISSSKDRILFFAFLYPSELLVGKQDNLTVFDWTDRIPGYSDEQPDLLDSIPAGDEPVTVVIDSIDALLSDIGSVSAVVTLLKKVRKRQNTNVLLHVVQSHESKDLVAHLSQTSFSSSLVLHTAYPTSPLLHISANYMTPPPPLSPEPKFWSVFLPISERQHDIDAIVYGGEGFGSHVTDEFVVETIVRGGQNGSRRRAIERKLRGWKSPNGFCELKDLAQLEELWGSKKISSETNTVADPTTDLSFNLNLTPSQQAARAQVPLPYMHQGDDPPKIQGAIYYDPDSADDIDDDDPDEDLDI